MIQGEYQSQSNAKTFVGNTMRYIFADHDTSFQITRIKEGIGEYRTQGQADPGSFRMHPVYDEILCQLADHFLGHWKDEIALMAIGGYGRQEMSPYSDIDIVFLRPEDAPEGIYRGIRSILYLLWDARVELGHSVRTVLECKQEANKDLAVLTSLMDTRLIWGSPEIFRKLLIERERLILDTDPLDLYLRIEGEILKSSDRFGHTIYLLEPHLKEGPGSLRYIQLINWLARMIFGAASFDDLPLLGVLGTLAVEEAKRGMEFLAEVRTRLHFIAGRRDDRLKFDIQRMLARDMGEHPGEDHHAVEMFMREYYRHAAAIDFFGRRVLAKTRLFLRRDMGAQAKILKLNESFYLGAGGIYHFHPDEFAEDPKEIIQAFQMIAQSRCEFDIRLVDFIRGKLRLIDEDFIQEPEVNKLFLDIFRFRGSVAPAIKSTMKIGVLELFIPDFAWIRFLPQFDVYHQYTVDLHTMAVLENMDEFRKPQKDHSDNLLHVIFLKLERPETLYLAGLFHDMAKGRGSGHELRGEQIARPVLERLGLPTDDIEDVCFLIRNHLAMTHLAFKKDLHDEALLSRFAETVISKRRLDLLFLLTHADLKAVGPTAMNSWRKMLLEELYYRALDIIQGDGEEGDSLEEWLKEIQDVVRQRIEPELQGPYVETLFKAAPPRYLLDYYPGVISDHFNYLLKFLEAEKKATIERGDLIAYKTDHTRRAYSAITIITQDRAGLFYRIAGAMTSNRINILSAWSHSLGDVAIASFHVNDIPEGTLDDPERWERFLVDLRQILKDEVDVEQLVATRRSRGRFTGGTAAPRFPVKVEVDTAASDVAVIIEINAHDRPGLLYDITRTLFEYGLYIVLTKITTEIDQAADVFYVQDESFHKITDFDRLDEIKAALHQRLVDMEAAHFSAPGETAYAF